MLRSAGISYSLNRFAEVRREKRLAEDVNDAVYEGMWRDAAREIGATVSPLGGGVLGVTLGDRGTRVWRQWTSLDSMVSVHTALDRRLTHSLLQAAALPIPDHVEFDLGSLPVAQRFLASLDGPCVVKPASGTAGGRSITSSVATPSQLARAAILAARYDGRLIAERQADGQVYRLLFLDGVLLDTLLREPPTVTGDGRSNIRQLMAVENRRRLAPGKATGSPPLTATLDCLFTLRAKGHDLASVPQDGEVVPIKTVTNQGGPSCTHTIKTAVSPDLIEEARGAAAAIGVRLAGIDIIAPSLDRSLRASGGAILEVNTGPGLYHHYNVADRENATKVAVPILSSLLGV